MGDWAVGEVVWTVTILLPDDGQEIIGVYATEDAAIQAKGTRFGYIEEFEIKG